ncbi:WD repeat-containing protein 13 isoform X2 [Cucumis melo var. makuwa]|uniref:WD repeat-containing protein 13 isoform X2 n=1 Tax=Cucumis melo var. makuwa TaxID=1194695 RepID=A0A5D3BUH7_CUCMM|nr:WD repeat-containing protein 13 isoform X2 [Cucumis melo var. makuwa]
MAEQRTEDGSSMKEGEEVEKEKLKKNVDPELLSCLLQPMSIGVDPDYIGIRRLLLYRKAEAAIFRRKALSIGVIHRTGGAMEKVMWHSAISYAGQGIGKAHVYQVFKALQETGW